MCSSVFVCVFRCVFAIGVCVCRCVCLGAYGDIGVCVGLVVGLLGVGLVGGWVCGSWFVEIVGLGGCSTF